LCGLLHVRLVTSNNEFTNISALTNVTNTLGAGETAPYTCALREMVSRPNVVGDATIQFLSKYDAPWPLWGQWKSTSPVFTLDITTNPPQWVQGRPLK
jgi:hypothetical protein